MTRARPTARRWPLLFLCLFAGLAGCVGDPDVDGASSPQVLDVSVERARWERAPAGCEDVAGDGLRVASCEGEASLAALVDRDGQVRCVDARTLILFEAHTLSSITPVAGDPSPQPNRPPPPEMATPKPTSSSTSP